MILKLPTPCGRPRQKARIQQEVSLDEILNLVLGLYENAGVTRRLIFSKRKLDFIVEPRQVFWWLANKYTNSSFSELGRFFSRDHSTAMHGIREIERLRKKDVWLKRLTDYLDGKIGTIVENRKLARQFTLTLVPKEGSEMKDCRRPKIREWI